MKRFFWLNTPELPSLWHHKFHTIKFATGFEQNGFTPIEVNSIENFEQMMPTTKDIVYVSNHGMNSFEGMNALHKLSKHECVFILWYYHDLIARSQLPTFKRWILTGEKFHRPPKLDTHIRFHEIQSCLNNYLPLTFSSAIDPEKIGKLARSENFLASFAGTGYKPNWCGRLASARNVLIRYAPPEFDDETRIRIFCDSVTCLGFHNDDNIANSVITERVFEGLSLGNVVISDNPACEEVTDGIVEFVDSYEKVLELVDKYWNDVDERKRKQSIGMKWSASYGTYKKICADFINMAEKL